MANEPDTSTAVTSAQTMASLTAELDPSLVAASIAQLPGDTKSLLNSILGGTQISQTNLEVLSAAAAATSCSTPSQKANAHKFPVVSPALTTPPTPVSIRKRGRPAVLEHEENNTKRRRGSGYGVKGGEKQSKGLRHFSQLVCEKVREKQITTYNEVADELVKELGEAELKAGSDVQIDQKNIRRRVYDALNVLMAMNIISKERKEIQWIGLPTNSLQECEHIQTQLTQYEERITKKTAELHDLIIQVLALKNLMKRNRELADKGTPPTQHSAIGLPFILVNTNKQTTIDCSISSDKTEYVFNFDDTFELHQDVDVLKRMGLDCGLSTGRCTGEALQEAKAMLPKCFEPIIEDIAHRSSLANIPPPSSPNSKATLRNVFQSDTITSTPTSHAPPNPITPVFSESSNGSGSSINSTSLALAAAALANNPAGVAAALSTLQQLQANQGSALLGTTSPLKVSVSPSSTPSQSRGVSIAARPVGTTSSPPQARGTVQSLVGQQNITQSPLLKTHAMNTTPTSLSFTNPPPLGKSPGAKIVTVQPLANNTSVAELISSLQQSILKQQQQIVGAHGTVPMETQASPITLPPPTTLPETTLANGSSNNALATSAMLSSFLPLKENN